MVFTANCSLRLRTTFLTVWTARLSDMPARRYFRALLFIEEYRFRSDSTALVKIRRNRHRRTCQNVHQHRSLLPVKHAEEAKDG